VKLRAWIRERTDVRMPTGMIHGGPSFAHVFGWVLLLLLLVEAVTGTALAAFYSPSTTSAWGSVAYVQDQMALGWLVRGLHYHGGSALVIVTGVHLLQTAVYGAYKKPRELVWWLGIVLLLLVLGFTVTGYVLRWDQAGYWANRVEVGIAASTPVVGKQIRELAIGGNEYGNLTLTRFYALHVIVLPAIVALGVLGHIVLALRHGATTLRPDMPATRRWPDQALRNAFAMALAFAALLGYAVSQHGADLAAPADPSAAFDARPLWYFRWLFELRHIFGSWERFAALAAPAVVAGILVALPIFDRTPSPALRNRMPFIGAVVGLGALVGILTLLSFRADARDADLAKRQDAADKLAIRARMLARDNGVPVTGAQDVFKTVPMYRARSLYAQRCRGCHDAGSKDRKGPIIGPGHGNRAWLRGFLTGPSGDAYWGRTKLAKTEDAMKAVDIAGGDLDDLVELLYAQSGAPDADTAKRDRGKALFDKACNDCHNLDEGVASASAPCLYGIASRDWFTGFIGNPKSAVHMGIDKSEMPRLDKDLSIVDRDLIAQYLVWLRTATPQDLEALGPL